MKWFILSIAGVAGLVVLFFLDPAVGGLYPPCPFRALTGFLCPGCGSLRAAHQLLRWHILAGFTLNPLMVLCLPLVCYGLMCQAVGDLAGRSLPTLFIRAGWIWLLLGITILFGILRNVPMCSFSWWLI